LIGQFAVLKTDLVQLSTSMNKVTTDYGEIPRLLRLMDMVLSYRLLMKSKNTINKRELKVDLGNQDLLSNKVSNVFQASLVKFTKSTIHKNQPMFKGLGYIPPTHHLQQLKRSCKLEKSTRNSRRTMRSHYPSEMVKELSIVSVINPDFTDTRDNQISLLLETTLLPGNE
jgi:hypothetical protein